MTAELETFTGVAAGVPYIVRPPSSAARERAPVVIAWHLLDPPRTEQAMAAALPLSGLEAWRIYLGLPLCGSRLPSGGLSELMERVRKDVVLELQQPITSRAVAEFPAALRALRERFGFGAGPIGLLGGSAGAAIAQRVLTETDLPVRALVLVNPLVQLRQAIDALGKRYDMTYVWSEPSLAFAARIDFVARAGEIAARAAPVLIVIGEADDEEAIRAPALRLHDALRAHARAEVALHNVPQLAHALAEEPGTEAAPQMHTAAQVDRLAVDWLRRHFCQPQPS